MHRRLRLLSSLVLALLLGACSGPPERGTAWDVDPAVEPVDEPVVDDGSVAAGTPGPARVVIDSEEPEAEAPVCRALVEHLAAAIADAEVTVLLDGATTVANLARASGFPAFEVESSLAEQQEAFAAGASVAGLSDEQYRGLLDSLGLSPIRGRVGAGPFDQLREACPNLAGQPELVLWAPRLQACYGPFEAVLVAVPDDVLRNAAAGVDAIAAAYQATGFPPACVPVMALAGEFLPASLNDGAISNAVAGYGPEGLEGLRALGAGAEASFEPMDDRIGEP